MASWHLYYSVDWEQVTEDDKVFLMWQIEDSLIPFNGTKMTEND